MKKYITNELIKKSLHNVEILIINNKNEKTVTNLKKYLTTYTNITYSEYYFINKQINKIYLSHSIYEGFNILSQNKICIKEYESKYLESYNNNNQLYFLFKEVENKIINEINNNNINRTNYNLLPFYYNIYLKEVK
jgi:sulfur relay (sulfurtransferase) DsrC/TusE family protein